MTAATVKASPRIVIEDLPDDEILSQEEMDLLFGAGKIRLGVESLEQRDLMAAQLTASLTGSVLRIEGTDKADQIRILQSNNQISIEGVAIQSGTTPRLSINVSEIDRIFVDGLEGDDQIWVGDGSKFLIPTLEVADLSGSDVLHSGGSTFQLGDTTHITKAVQFGGDTYTIQNGDLFRNGSKLSLAGYSLAAASLSVGDKGLAIGGFANMGFMGVVQFQGTINTNGDFALTTDALKPTDLFGGSVKLSAATITLSSAGAKLTAHADILSFGYADVEGLLVPGQDYKLTGKGGVKLGSLSYDAVDFTLGNADLDFKIPVPAIGDVAMRGSYKPDGSFYIQGTYPGQVAVGPVVLKNITVGMGNDRFMIGSDASVADLDFALDAHVEGVIYFDGRYTLKGDARALNLGSFSFGTATVVISNDPAETKLSDRTVQMTIDGKVGVPGISFGPKSTLHGIVNSKGYYLLQGEDAFEVAGMKLQQTKFKLEKGVGFTFEGGWNYGIYNAAFSGSITSGGKATFTGQASAAKVGSLDLGTLSINGEAEKGSFVLTSTAKGVSVGGFSFGDGTVRITNRGTDRGAIVTTFSGKTQIPLGPKVSFAGVISTDGRFELSATETLTIAGLSLSKAKFQLNSSGKMTFQAELNHLIYRFNVEGTIDPKGIVTLSGTGSSAKLPNGFSLASLKVAAELDSTKNHYFMRIEGTSNVLIANVAFAAEMTGNGSTWPAPVLRGTASVGGALGEVFSGSASFEVAADRVTFTGSLTLKRTGLGVSVSGSIKSDGTLTYDAKDSAGKWVARLIGEGAEKIQQTYEKGVLVLETITNSGVKTAERIWSAAGSLLRETKWSNVTKVFEAWQANDGKWVEETWGGAQKYWKGVWNKAGSGAQMLSRYVEQLDGKWVEETWGGAQKYWKGVWNKVGSGAQMLSRYVEQLDGKWVEETWGGAQKYWKGVWNKAGSGAQMLSRYARDWSDNWTEEYWGRSTEKYWKGVWNSANNMTARVTSRLDGYWVEEYWGNGQDYWRGIWDQSNKMRERYVINAGQRILETWDAANRYGKSIYNSAGQLISASGVSGWANSIGKALGI
jgi:hypothetical protein